MINLLEKIFKFKENNSNIKTELLAGITTFFTMSYLLVLSPKILTKAGLTLEPTIAITALTVFFCSIIMGLIANKPYVLAPFLGDTAFIVYTIVISLGFPIETIFASLFIIGILLLIMTLTNVRIKIVDMIPTTLKLTYCIGLGLFFIFLSLKDIGIVNFTQKTIPIESGNFTSINILLGLFCFILLITLIKKNIKGAVIISIITTTLLGIIIGDVELPKNILTIPTTINDSILQLDINKRIFTNILPIIYLNKYRYSWCISKFGI